MNWLENYCATCKRICIFNLCLWYGQFINSYLLGENKTRYLVATQVTIIISVCIINKIFIIEPTHYGLLKSYKYMEAKITVRNIKSCFIVSFCFPSRTGYHKYPFTEIILSLSGSYARFPHIMKTLFFKADKLLLQIMPCSTALLSLAFCTAAAVCFAVVNGIRDMISASSSPVHLVRLENAEERLFGAASKFSSFSLLWKKCLARFKTFTTVRELLLTNSGGLLISWAISWISSGAMSMSVFSGGVSTSRISGSEIKWF